MGFENNIRIWNDTVNKCEMIRTRSDKSIKYDYLDITPVKRYDKMDVIVRNVDSIKGGMVLLNMGFNPVVLNLADDVFPGGHVRMGSGAQEESLFRRTNYYQTLNHETGFYPLVNTELVYSPSVLVIKDENNRDLDLAEYFRISFIACPGIKKPKLIDGKFRNLDKELFKKKIKNILNVAYNHNHDSVVLGALGCGAWECPQEEVAHLFKEVVDEYNLCFKFILFAILDVDKGDYIVKNENLNKSNYEIFSKILENR